MLLNHYTAFLEKHLQGRIGSLTSESGVTNTFTSLRYQSEVALLPMLLHQHGEIIVGSDNTAETGNSYNLKKKITSGINLGLARSVIDNDDGSYSSIVVANCTNTSSDPITIGEIGIRTSYDYPGTAFIVLDRTPLGTPLTIQPGEVGRIVYTITMA